jgi:hypothetical protein
MEIGAGPKPVSVPSTSTARPLDLLPVVGLLHFWEGDMAKQISKGKVMADMRAAMKAEKPISVQYGKMDNKKGQTHKGSGRKK